MSPASLQSCTVMQSEVEPQGPLLPKSECRPVVWQQAELSSLRGIEQWLDSCLSPQMWPLSKSSWRNSALSLNPCGPMSHKSQRVFNIEKRKSSFHTVHREPSTWHCSVSLPGRWELSETTHSLFSLPIVTPTSGLLQMTGEHPNLHKAGGDRSCVLEKFTKIDNLHIAASICLGLRDLSSSIYIKYSSLKRLHVFKQHSASSEERGGGGSVQGYGSASGGPGDQF